MSGPNLPINMASMNIIFPGILKSGTIPVEVPLVLNADTVSNSKFRNGISGSVIVSVGTIRSKNTTPSTATVMALNTCAFAISLPNASALGRLRIDDITTAIITAKVFTFIPPATDPDAPPINIRAGYTNFVKSPVSLKSTVEKPAVRPLIEWNDADTSLSHKFTSSIVCDNSARKNTAAPNMYRAIVVTITNLVFKLNLENLRSL